MVPRSNLIRAKERDGRKFEMHCSRLLLNGLQLMGVRVECVDCLFQGCQTEGPPRAIWVTFVLS
jgi:hypothetical protein